MPQTQKEKPTKRIQKYSEGKMYQRVCRKDMTKGFLLLRKCVPGTKKLNRSDMLMETVNYIKELQNKIKELEKECTDSAQREPLMPDSSPTDLDTGISSLTIKRKYTKEEMREKRRKERRVYIKDMTKGFNLLNKCLPGTKKLFHIDMLMKTVSYIKELQNKPKELEKESLKESKKRVNYIKELKNKIKQLEKESTRQTPTGMERDSVPKITLHYYGTEQNCTDSAPREPQIPRRSLTDLDTGLISYSSEMEDLTTVVASTITSEEESWRETSCVMDVTVRTTSEEIRESVIQSPEEEELPEFNSVEDLRQWLGL
jgi:hypothetical protein